uniref:Complement component c3a, duplicate 5 n=1 Tax=Myripristis murdjan TaxID=586833 RepID=A0A667XCD2_9TELE
HPYTLVTQSEGQVLSAPNLLRVGTPEKIFVECQDCSGSDINVEISVMNHPTKSKRLAHKVETLTSQNNFQALSEITLPAADFDRDPTLKQYVYLQAKFPDRVLEKVVLVSFQSGYIFIQTDKTLYTPNSKIHYRMFAVTPGMKPVERNDDGQHDASIAIEIQTPDGIIFPHDTVSLKSGIHSGHYKLPEIASPGLWKVVAKFQSNPQLSYSAEVEVKEYVLPSFEVKLTSQKAFFYVDTQELIINIKATYLFGENVDGTAYVVFGVVHMVHKDQKKSFPASLQRIPVRNGVGEVKLLREHITKTFSNIRELEGYSIFVAVSVLTETGSEMVEAELRGIQIVTSPYTIHFKRTPKYFKPGMSFDVTLHVLNPDDTPASGIPVVVGPGDVAGQTGANGMAKLTINTVAGDSNLNINAKTNDPNIAEDKQAVATMTAKPYATSSSNYLHIGVDTSEVNLGDNLKINLILNKQGNHDITYLILSRGQLVKSGHHRAQGQVLITLIELVTKEMLPSFRIVAYYHVNEEVVSDSIWVDVTDSCMGSLKLESTRAVPSFEPRKLFGLRITGDPGATVGLVAVDKGVYVLNNKHRLTQKKVWDIVEQYDTGCTPGGGQDSMAVFYDAGLIFKSSMASGTADRLELKCPVVSRRRRATTILDVRTTLASHFQEKLQRQCCVDGMKDTPLSYNCERRSEYITDGAACVEAFLHCCQELARQRAEMKHDSLILARSEEDDRSYMDSSEIVSRTKFPESWLWSDVILPNCPNCETTSVVKNIPLQDSITTWQFTGISLSSTNGICVADPLEVIVRKQFFIDLRLPYSAVRGEQLEVKAILHNYSPDLATVRVDLLEEEHVCSSALKRGRYRQEIKVGPDSTRAVPFIIIPMKEGRVRIEVKAAVKDSSLNDGIMKMLLVVPEGVLIKTPKNVTLNPSEHGGRQEETINSAIPKKDLVPNTPTSTEISVNGGTQMGTLVESAVSGNSMGSLIRTPYGCGEQNMHSTALPVIAATYLDKTNQWEAVGFDKRDEALRHIKTGYQNQLNYRKDDGSFAVWEHRKSSTWLTAYVAKVFAMANNLVAVQNNVLCDAIKWLILKRQQPDGVFNELGFVYDGLMTGDGRDFDVSLTAFIVIAMQESRTLCAATVNSLPGSIDKSVGYLERRLPSLTNPYAVAITSYALANENKLNREILDRFATSVKMYNTVTIHYARPIVRWFNKQKKVGGGYGSTQATMIVYQAISEYWTNAKEVDYELNVDIFLPGKAKPDRYHFNRENYYATRTSKVNDINQDVKINATGTGEATLTLVSLYYALPKEKESDCQRFNLSVQMLPEKTDENEKIYKLKIEILYMDKDRDATMSILDIGLLTGFTVNTDDLDLLSKGRDRTISKYEMNTVLSERGSLIIYLDKVSHKRPDEIAFRITQTMKVGVLQPAAVSVYEYYDQTPCVKFYHPQRRGGELLQLCQKDECICAEENCSMQKKGKIDNEERTAKACEVEHDSKIDYVYKVRLEKFEADIATDIYKMRIEEVIKEGSYDVGAQGGLREFLSYQHCRESLNLKEDKTYLIMGTSRDMYRDDETGGYRYILGERMWIEHWPSEAECQTDEYRPVCLGMEKLVEQYTIFGCQQ